MWLRKLLGIGAAHRTPTRAQQEGRALDDFQKHFRLSFADPDLLKLALTHRSYLSVTGQGPRESNERLEFLGDSVLGLVTSEFLYRENPEEHEGELTKAKSLLVSKAILSRRALAMGLGRFVLMSHSEVESGGRQRLSILADAFEAVIGAIYLDQGFEPARAFIHRWLLRESDEIVADKRHTNYKSHLQEYVQSTWRTHPIYRIRSEMGPDHSKHFLVEVLVGKRTLGDGRGRNKKEAEQAAARNALERAGVNVGGEELESEPTPVEPRSVGSRGRTAEPIEAPEVEPDVDFESERHGRGRRRGRRGGRDREERGTTAPPAPEPPAPYPASPGVPRRAAEPSTGRLASPTRRLQPLPEVTEERPVLPEREPPPSSFEEDFDDVGRPEGPLEELHIDPYAWGSDPSDEPAAEPEARPEMEHDPEDEDEDEEEEEDEDEFEDESEDEPAIESPEPDDDVRPEPPRAERSRREPSRSESFRTEARPEPPRNEPVRPEPARSEPVRPEPPRPEPPAPSPSFGRRRSRR